MNKWMLTLNYFLAQDMGKPIKRKDYLRTMKRFNLKPVTCDNNRNILMTAGYLQRIKRGVYKVTQPISIYLTYTQARKEAYPNPCPVYKE